MNTYYREARQDTHTLLIYSVLLRRDGTSGTAPLHPGLLTYVNYPFDYTYV